MPLAIALYIECSSSIASTTRSGSLLTEVSFFAFFTDQSEHSSSQLHNFFVQFNTYFKHDV
jgi:hypothetical protein